MSGKRVPRIMRKPGLAGRGATRKRRIQKKAEPGDPRLNLAERAFAAGGRNGLRAGGIACMPTREGRPYLAAATGAFSRKVVGWSMSGRIAEKAAIDSIGRAVGREGPPDDGGLVSYDGQGAQYASRSFRRCLDSRRSPVGIKARHAAGRRGGVPFFKTLKGELVEGRSYGTRDGAKRDIFKRIEPYRNRARMHSVLDCMPPVEYERQYA